MIAVVFVEQDLLAISRPAQQQFGCDQNTIPSQHSANSIANVTHSGVISG
jgi:hypothetical protein